MTSAGNDFLITDYKRVRKNSQWAKKIPELCHRRFGIGADGICFLSPSKKAHLQWDFFNSDGSRAAMCGNAACCIIQYVFERKLLPKTKFPLTFIIGKKILSGKMVNKKPVLSCPLPAILYKQRNVKIKGKKIVFDVVNSGVPHILIKTNKVSEEKRALAQRLRKRYARCNITFYKKKIGGAEAAVFERGVEDFTLSCGTGALAVSKILQTKMNQSFVIKMPGGALKVSFIENRCSLEAPVRLTASFTPYFENLDSKKQKLSHFFKSI